MKAVVAAFNQEKALVGAFSVITNLRMELFEALVETMVSQVHDIYQTNPAFKKRICLGILCFNTVNQWEIITQSSCREEMEK